MRVGKRLLLIALVLFSCVGCDQITKEIARKSLGNSGPIILFDNIFRLQYAENPGAFLSVGAGSSEHARFWIFIVVVGMFLLGMLVYLIASSHNSRANIIALSLVTGGGISNMVDRIFNEGRVIDFMNVGIGSIRTGIFNVADIAITGGAVWLLVISPRGKRRIHL